MNRLLLDKFKSATTLHRKTLVGIACALNYAIYPALIALFALEWTSTSTTADKVALGFTLVTGKELFCFLVYFIVSGPANFLKDVRKNLFTKHGLIFAIAGVFGGPVGYSLVTIGALFVGGALAVMLTSTSTIFTAIFEFWFLKRKFSRMKIIGISIAGFSTILLSVLASNDWNWSSTAIIGIILSLMGALSWTTENILMDYGMRKVGKNVNSNSALRIKLIISAIAMLVVFMPLASLFTGKVAMSYGYFVRFFGEMKMFWGIVTVGLFMYLARFFFLKSVKMQGATAGFMWYTLSSLFAPIMILLLSYVFNITALQGDTVTLKTWWFWIFGILLLIGVAISNVEFKKKKKKTA